MSRSERRSEVVDADGNCVDEREEMRLKRADDWIATRRGPEKEVDDEVLDGR